MAWEERTVKAMRKEFVQRVLAKEKSKAALCREYGISRPTGDKWVRRFQEGQSLSDQSRAPKTQTGRIAPEMETSIVQLRRHYAGAQYCKTCGKHQTFSVRPQGPETYFQPDIRT